METEKSSKEALAAAAAPTLEDISRLAAASSPRIATMLLYFRDHLFDPALNVYAVKAACGLRDNSIGLRFHREVGLAPGIFITDCRLAVAERLLTGSWLPIWKVASLVGYSTIQVFSRAYVRRKGVRPSSVRGQAAPPEPVSAAAPLEPETDFFSRAFAGQLDSHEATELIVRLLRIYPPQSLPAASAA